MIKTSVKLLTAKIVGEAAALGLIIIAARNLSALDNGKLLLLLSTVFLLGPILSLGLSSCASRFVSVYKHKNDKNSIVGFLIYYVSVVIASGLIVFTAMQFLPPSEAAVGAGTIFLVSVLFSLQILTKECLRSLGYGFRSEIGFQGLRSGVPLLGAVVLITFSALSFPTILGLVILGLVLSIAYDGAIIWTSLKGAWRVPGFHPREWLSAAASLFVVTVARVALERADVVVVGFMLGLHEAAIYGVVARIATLPQFATDPIRGAARPRLAILIHEQRSTDLASTCTQGSIILMAAVVLPTILFVGLAPVILNAFGSVYVSTEAVLALTILLALRAFASIWGLSPALLSMSPHHRYYAALSGIILVVYIGTMFMFSQSGIVAVAAVTGLAWLLYHAGCAFVAKAVIGTSGGVPLRPKAWVSAAADGYASLQRFLRR